MPPGTVRRQEPGPPPCGKHPLTASEPPRRGSAGLAVATACYDGRYNSVPTDTDGKPCKAGSFEFSPLETVSFANCSTKPDVEHAENVVLSSGLRAHRPKQSRTGTGDAQRSIVLQRFWLNKNEENQIRREDGFYPLFLA
ncbi:hypothetical protein CB1_000345031 [Camelus ferus]|nr:hypothetical protein CB1_000345031 [Camelus ferus]